MRNFEVLAQTVLENMFKGYGLKFDCNCEEVFQNSARFYYDDSLEREWQVAFEIVEDEDEEEKIEWCLYARCGEDWNTSCSGEMDLDGNFL